MRVHIDAPAGADPLDIAKAVVGPHTLLKAEPTGPARSPFSRWKALSELYSRVEDMYRSQAKRMVRAVVRYIESIHGKKLAKAEGGPSPVPLLTPEQLEVVAQIIRDHHTGFAIRIGADTSETQDEIQRLLDDGLLPPEALDIIEDSYHYGQVVGSLRQFDETKRAKDFSYDEFKKRIARRPVSVDAHDRAAMDWAKHSVAIHCRGLGNRIADDLSTTIIDADAELRRKYVTEIRDATEANIERHQTWRRLASDLGHKTEDWTRDMMRIAATEKQNAFQEGFSQSLIEREGDPDTVYVAKIPSPSACPDCVRLHLTQGQGSPPRVFLLSELHNNGTNVGKKRSDWKPVVGTVHPWCACELVHVPPGWRFAKKPPEGEGWTKVPGKSGAWRRKDGDDWKHWSPELEPELELERSEASFARDLKKAIMRYRNVPDDELSIRVGDPVLCQEIEKVVARTPRELFTSRTGVTLITTDIARVGSELAMGDLAYWTGNEIRISQTLPPEKLAFVLEHEFGHAPNVFLLHRLGSDQEVRRWHDDLYEVSRGEGYVSHYAKVHPIENSAEVTRLYLYARGYLMGRYPRQFEYVHRDYRDLFGDRVQVA